FFFGFRALFEVFLPVDIRDKFRALTDTSYRPKYTGRGMPEPWRCTDTWQWDQHHRIGRRDLHLDRHYRAPGVMTSYRRLASTTSRSRRVGVTHWSSFR